MMTHPSDQYRYSFASQHHASSSSSRLSFSASPLTTSYVNLRHRQPFVCTLLQLQTGRDGRTTEDSSHPSTGGGEMSCKPSAAVPPSLSLAPTNEQTNTMLKSAVWRWSRQMSAGTDDHRDEDGVWLGTSIEIWRYTHQLRRVKSARTIFILNNMTFSLFFFKFYWL